jgi:hypothetical protein
MAGKKSPQRIESAIFSRIKRWGSGSVVLSANSLEVGSRQAIGVALYRLEKSKSIRRLSRGVYDYPIENSLLGELSPTIKAITQALSWHLKTEALPRSRNILSRSYPSKKPLQKNGSKRRAIKRLR